MAGTSAGLVLLDRRDRRTVAADPKASALARPLQGRAARLRSADGTELHVEVFGSESGPPVVLVHGWMCSLQLWRRQIVDLASDHYVVAYDLRGHGRSGTAVTGDYSVDALAADLDAVLHHTMAAPRPMVLAGHSMGAMGIVAWARAHPGKVRARVAGVVLANTGVEELVGRARVAALGTRLAPLRAAVGSRLLGSALPLPSRPRAVVSRVVRFLTLGPSASPAEVAFATEMVMACSAAVRAGFGTTLAAVDLLDGLDAVVVPAVVLTAEHDRLTPSVHGRRIAEALPDATLVEIPGVGHLTPIEAPCEVTGAIRRVAR